MLKFKLNHGRVEKWKNQFALKVSCVEFSSYLYTKYQVFESNRSGDIVFTRNYSPNLPFLHLSIQVTYISNCKSLKIS